MRSNERNNLGDYCWEYNCLESRLNGSMYCPYHQRLEESKIRMKPTERANQNQAANDRQVGGNHYSKGNEEQHWDRMWRLYREAWFVGNITKYVERYRRKDGIKDLEKAKHYLEKLIELEKADEASKDTNPYLEVKKVNMSIPSKETCQLCNKKFQDGDDIYFDLLIGDICCECYKQQTPTVEVCHES